MSVFTDVGPKEIKALDADQLTLLLKKLLHLEALAHDIPLGCTHVPLDITVPDGGVDGRIKWDGGPERTHFIPARETIFQAKAKEMCEGDIRTEMLQRGKRTLKLRIEEVLDASGAYIVFCNRSPQGCRVTKMRAILHEAGRNDAESAEVDFYDRTKIADWTNRHPPAVLYVRECNGQSLPGGFQLWEEWSRYSEWQRRYFRSERLAEYISRLREGLAKPGSCFRITGLSGLGKTRLALEALRPPEAPDPLQQALSDAVLYRKADENQDSILRVARNLANQGARAILVADECELELHEKLKGEVTKNGSQLSLLSLDFVDKQEPPDCLIRLEPKHLEDVVVEMLKEAYPGLREWHVRDIANLAEGFPKIAQLLAEAQLGDDDHVGRLTELRLVERMLSGREQPDQTHLRALIACAVFSRIGFEKDLTGERDLVAAHVAGLSSRDFFEACHQYMTKGILQKRGRYVRLTPRPLALALAERWWQATSPEEVCRLVKRLEKEPLFAPFIEQTKLLDYVPEVKHAVGEMCAPEGLCGCDQKVATEVGLKTLAELAEVHSSAVIESLRRSFGGWTSAKWRKRTHLHLSVYWVLRKLCWWPEHFEEAATLWLRVAAAVAEGYRDQIRDDFTQLFRIRLPGTQSSPSERICLIDAALASKALEERKLAIGMLGQALETGGASRMGGMESQGSRKAQQDWFPRSPQDWDEVQEYRKRCLEILTGLATGSDHLATLAQKELGSRLAGLIGTGLLECIDHVVAQVGAYLNGYWPDATRRLRHYLSYSRDRGEKEEIRLKVEQWLAQLDPTNTADKLRAVVAEADFEHTRGPDGRVIDLAARRAEALAEELVASGTKWYANMPVLLKGTQRQTAVFGRKLAELAKDPEPFINVAFDHLRRIGEHGEPLLIIGFVGGLSEEWQRRTIDRVLDDKALAKYTIAFLRGLIPNEVQLNRLIELLTKGQVPLASLRLFAFGHSLQRIPGSILCSFLRQVCPLGVDGARSVLEICCSHCGNHENLWRAFRDPVILALSSPSLLRDSDGEAPLQMYAWYDTVHTLLEMGEVDSQLAATVVESILHACKDMSCHISLDRDVRAVLVELLGCHVKTVWPLLGEALLSQERWFAHRVSELIGAEYNTWTEQDVISTVPDDVILEWCDSKAPDGPRAIARIARLYQDDEENAAWTPLASELIGKYGADKEVRQGIALNLARFSFCGSAVPHFRLRIQLMEQLKSHSNHQVRQWAADLANDYEDRIKEETTEDEEHTIRCE